MNKTVCWNCDKVFEYDGEKYRDVKCVFCGAENSIFNPDKPDYLPPEGYPKTTEAEWLNKEEEMIDYSNEKYQGKFIYMPRIGETLVVEIKEVREVKSDNPKFNFSENVPVMIGGEQGIDDDGEPLFKKKDLGYHIEAELTNGKILSVTSMSAFLSVFKKYEIQDGDKVKIEHPEKGVWKVEKLNG